MNSNINAKIYGFIKVGDLGAFSEIIGKAIENVSETGKQRILLLCIKYGRIEFIKPLFLAYVPSGKNPLFNIRKCKELYFAATEMKIELFKVLREFRPSDVVLVKTASDLLMSSRPKKDLKLLKYLLDSKMNYCNPEKPSAENLTGCFHSNIAHGALYFVSRYRPELIGDILSIKRHENSKHSDERHMLVYAVNSGWFRVVREMIDHGIEIDCSYEPNGMTSPLLVAIKNSRLDIAKYLILKGAYLDATDQAGLTAFHYYARFCDISMMKLLLNLGCKHDDPKWKRSALSLALDQRNLEEPKLLACVKFLIENAGLKYRIGSDNLPYLAALYGYNDIFEYLVRNCDDMNALGYATQTCITSNFRSAFDVLQQHKKFNFDHKEGYEGHTLIDAAAESVYWCKKLIECGFDVNRDYKQNGRTLLYGAVRRGVAENVSLLLDYGAKVSGKLEKTILSMSTHPEFCRGQNFTILDLLLNAGADPDLVGDRCAEYMDYLFKFQSRTEIIEKW